MFNISANILPPEEEEDDFETRVSRALEIANAELEDDDEDYRPRPKAKEDIRRDVEQYNFTDEEEIEEELDIYEKSFTDELSKLLKVYQVKKPARQTIIQQSKRLEQDGEFIHPNDLKEKLIAIGKITEKVSAIIVKDYTALLDRFEGGNQYQTDFQPTRRSRDYDRGGSYSRRDRPQPMTIQDFMQLEREKAAMESIQEQISDKDFQIQVVMQEKQKMEEKMERTEAEMKILKQDHKEEIREYQREIKALEKDLFKSEIEAVKVQASQSFSSDGVKIVDKIITTGAGAKALSVLTDLGKPIQPMPSDSRVVEEKAEPVRNIDIPATTPIINFNDLIVDDEDEQ